MTEDTVSQDPSGDSVRTHSLYDTTDEHRESENVTVKVGLRAICFEGGHELQKALEQLRLSERKTILSELKECGREERSSEGGDESSGKTWPRRLFTLLDLLLGQSLFALIPSRFETLPERLGCVVGLIREEAGQLWSDRRGNSTHWQSPEVFFSQELGVALLHPVRRGGQYYATTGMALGAHMGVSQEKVKREKMLARRRGHSS